MQFMSDMFLTLSLAAKCGLLPSPEQRGPGSCPELHLPKGYRNRQHDQRTLSPLPNYSLQRCRLRRRAILREHPSVHRGRLT